MILCPENLPTIQGHEPCQVLTIVDTCDWIKLTNARGVLITVMWFYAQNKDWTLTVHESDDGTGTSPLATVFPIWVNADTAASDTMVRQDDAVTYIILGSTGKNHIVVFYISAASLTATYDWIQLGTAEAGGGTTNFASVMYQLVGARYPQLTPPTAII